MKKLILLLVSCPAFLFAQNVELKSGLEDVQDYVNPLSINDVQKPEGEMAFNKSRNLKFKDQPYDFIQIGRSWYDLQTNHSIGTRIILHSNGTVSAVWTTSPDNSNASFPNRGAGYNHYDGSDWDAVVNTRIENPGSRTGWPSIGLLSNGSEYILAHNASSGGLYFSQNENIGSTVWTTDGVILDDTSGVSGAPIWNRSAASNGYVHVISAYTVSGSNDTVTKDGVFNPNVYSRSSDNGQTWPVYLSMLPGYDSSRSVNGGGDNYDITARDSIVAVVMGGYGEPVTMWKSTDNGDNWTMFPVNDFPYPGTKRVQWSGDTLESSDGSMDVLIDDEGTVHVFYGRMRYLRGYFAQSGDTVVTFFPGTSGIMYWKEGMTDAEFIAGALDRDGNQQLDITSETISGLTGTNTFPDPNFFHVSRYNSNGISTFPNAALDENGDIYLIFSAPSEYALHWTNTNYRDVLVTYSQDKGDNWAAIQNLTQNDFTEDVFASLAQDANGFLHMVWQRDDIPGTNLQNNTADDNHPANDNQIMYAAIPVASITSGLIGQHTVGQEDLDKTAELFFVSQSYPNPTDNYAEATVFLLNGAELQLEITDMFGRTVNSGSIGFHNAGNHVITLDASSLTAGMYFYTISSPDHSITRKMQVR